MNRNYNRLPRIMGAYETTYLARQGKDLLQRLEHTEYNAHSRGEAFLVQNFGELAQSMTLELVAWELMDSFENRELQVEFHYCLHISGGRLQEGEFGNSTRIPGLKLVVEVTGSDFKGQFVNGEMKLINEFEAARIIDRAVHKR